MVICSLLFPGLSTTLRVSVRYFLASHPLLVIGSSHSLRTTSCPDCPGGGLVLTHTFSTCQKGSKLAFNHLVQDPRKNFKTR